MTLLTRLSLANRLIVGLVGLAVVVFGVIATVSLRQELLPATQVPTAIVTATYPGTSPDLVAREVATPLEQSVSGISGVTRVRAVSTNGVAALTVEWTYGLDDDKMASDIRTAVDAVRPQLADAVKTDVRVGSTADIPVLVLAVASDAPVGTLARRVDDVVVPQLAKVSGVRQVQLAGENVTELAVTLRPDQLRKHDLSAAAVTQAIQAQASVIPAGNSYAGSTELAIQVGTTPLTAKEVASWPIPAPKGAVRLSSLATIKVSSVEATTLARSDGRPALSLNVLKESDADAVEVSQAIRSQLPALTDSIGSNASTNIVFDQAPSIRQSIDDLAVEGGMGLTFAVLIILVFLLSVRSTLITAISIPLSLLIALIGLQVGDYSLNIFTLAALTVAVGRVVDDSIVVIENIKRHHAGRGGAELGKRQLPEKPGPPTRSAPQQGVRGVVPPDGYGALTPGEIVGSVREVAGAVTASTLTTVAVFVPVAVVSGITGELFRPFSITVAMALGASLLVSMTIVPVLAYWFMGGTSARRAAPGTAAPAEETVIPASAPPAAAVAAAAPLTRAATAAPATAPPARAVAAAPAAGEEDKVTALQRGYLPVLRLALRRPLLTVLVAILIFTGTMGAATLLKTDFLESFEDKTTLYITQKLPVGTRLDATSDAARQVEAVLDASPGVKQYLTTVGEGGTNQASMFVSLTGKDAYDSTLADLKQSFAELSGVGEVKVGSINRGTNNDLTVTVTGDNAAGLEATAGRVQTMLQNTSGLVDVTSDLTARRPLLQIQLNRTKAADLGFTSAEVGQAISNALRGTKVGTIVLQGQTRDIVVRPQDAKQATPAQIGKLELPVSQLQQQQAVDRATKKLKARQDALKDQADQLSQRGDELADLQKDLGNRQKAAAKEQQAEALQAAADQRAELCKARTKATSALASAQRSLRQLTSNPPPAPRPVTVPTPGPGQTPIPVTQEQLAAQLAAQQAAQRYAAYQQQVAQLRAAVSQASAQVKQLDAQVSAAASQAAKSADQQAQQNAFSAEQDALTQEQSDLGDSQKDLTREQSDLADEQADIADIRARPIRVSDIAAVKQQLAPSAVTQIDGTRAVTLTATPEGKDLGALTSTVRQQIADLPDVPPGIAIDLGGASDDQAEAFRQLGLAMLLAIVIVFLIMVATFRSVVQPLILLTSIPFAATGAVAGLLLTDTALGVPALVGLLMLIGIVVTNAIVLIDLINQHRARGEGLQSAIVHGARLRLRPIIMTATATICALIPMGLGLTGGGAFISRPLAVVVIGGLVTSTLLTLLLVPTIYSLVERYGERRRLRRAAEVVPAEA